MLDTSWVGSLVATFQNIGWGILNFLPRLLGALVLLLVGVLIADLLGMLIAKLIRATKVDVLIQKAGVEHYFTRAGIKIDLGKFIGVIVKWFLILVVLVEALSVLELTQVTLFLQNVLNYLPNVVVAILILFAGFVIGDVLQRIVIHSAKATNLGKPLFLGGATKWAIWIFTVLVALYQLGIATLLSETILNGIVIALALAFGLAFGLGGQQHASEVIGKFRSEISDKK
jgi:small-conductance mechanosensitive channel